MSSSMGRILLTGGAGFIGSHLAEALLRRKTTLAIIDDLNQFYSPERKRSNLEEIRRVAEFEFFQADIRQFAALHSIFSLPTSFQPVLQSCWKGFFGLDLSRQLS